MLKKIAGSFITVLIILGTVSGSLSADFTFSSDKKKILSPDTFEPTKVVLGTDLGIGHFRNPADMTCDSEGNIYVFDTGNRRIVKLDSELNLIKEIEITSANGSAYAIQDPTCIYVWTNGDIYVTDKRRGRIVVMNSEGVVHSVFEGLETDLLADNIVFAPRRLVVNSIGSMFVISDNINQGIVQMDKNGDFIRFFGADRIQETALYRLTMSWRRFLSQSQLSGDRQFTPLEYTNIDIDSEDFIYTVVQYNSNKKETIKDQIRKMNPNGNNILPSQVYGDQNPTTVRGAYQWSKFVNITVDKDGFIYGLDTYDIDSTKNGARIFWYTSDGELLSCFGSRSSNWGGMLDATAIEAVGDNIVILDSNKQALIMFSPTTFGKTVKEGVLLNQKGRYEEALHSWEYVIEQNTNFEMAYIGAARAYQLMGEYELGMEYAMIGNHKKLYSEIKKELRTVNMRNNFSFYFAMVIIVPIVILILSKIWKKRKLKAKELK